VPNNLEAFLVLETSVKPRLATPKTVLLIVPGTNGPTGQLVPVLVLLVVPNSKTEPKTLHNLEVLSALAFLPKLKPVTPSLAPSIVLGMAGVLGPPHALSRAVAEFFQEPEPPILLNLEVFLALETPQPPILVQLVSRVTLTAFGMPGETGLSVVCLVLLVLKPKTVQMYQPKVQELLVLVLQPNNSLVTRKTAQLIVP